MSVVVVKASQFPDSSLTHEQSVVTYTTNLASNNTPLI